MAHTAAIQSEELALLGLDASCAAINSRAQSAVSASQYSAVTCSAVVRYKAPPASCTLS